MNNPIILIKIAIYIFCIVIISCCSGYSREIFIENKIKTTPQVTPPAHPFPKKWADNRITYSLLGHSTVLLNIFGETIITDPLLFNRIGPPEIFQNYFGIKRIQPLPLQRSELPPIDTILISHAHYDHLDLPSIKYLQQINNNTKVITPRKTAFLIPKKTDKQELDWNKELITPQGTKIKAFRVEHYSYVGWGDRSVLMGFNGYLLEKKGVKIAFFGDTAYRRYRDKNGVYQNGISTKVNWKSRVDANGKVDLCILPIGDYYYSHNHTDPMEALAISEEVGCKKVLPVHYGTFILTPQKKMAYNTPLSLLKEQIKNKKFKNRTLCKTIYGKELPIALTGNECYLSEKQ